MKNNKRVDIQLTQTVRSGPAVLGLKPVLWLQELKKTHHPVVNEWARPPLLYSMARLHIFNHINAYHSFMSKENESKEEIERDIEVFHEIWGLFLEKGSIKMGEFTFHSSASILEKMKPFDTPQSSYSPELFSGLRSYISISFKSNSVEESREKANILFDDVQSVLRFLFCSPGDSKDIGITNFKSKVDETYAITDSEEFHMSMDHKGGLIPINFLAATNLPTVEKTLCLITKNRTNVENRMLNAAIWGGKAIYEGATAIGYLQCMMAIESLLNVDQGQIISPSITNQIAERTAFLLYDSLQDRLIMDKKMRELYNARSKIAHGKDYKLSESHFHESYQILRYLVSFFMTDPKLEEIKTEKELSNHFKERMYRSSL